MYSHYFKFVFLPSGGSCYQSYVTRSCHICCTCSVLIVIHLGVLEFEFEFEL